MGGIITLFAASLFTFIRSVVSFIFGVGVIKFVLFTIIGFIVSALFGFITNLLIGPQSILDTLPTLPGGLLYAFNVFEVQFGLGVFIAAYVLRFMIRRIPFIG